MKYFLFIDSTVLGASVHEFPNYHQAEAWVWKHYYAFSFEKVEDGLKFTLHHRVDLVQLFAGERVTILPEEYHE